MSKNITYQKLLLNSTYLFFSVLIIIKILQATEIFILNESIHQINQNSSEWIIDKERKIVKNKKLNFQFKIPDEMYFHEISDFKSEDNLFGGRILGVLSSSEFEKERYPFCKIILTNPQTEFYLDSQMQKYFENLKNKEEASEINILKKNIEKLDGRFWIYYDMIRPRYVKAGYYKISISDNNSIILFITENLIEKAYHEPSIQEFLNNFQI